MDQKESDLINAEEAADMLDVSTKHVYAWVNSNQLPISVINRVGRGKRGLRLSRQKLQEWANGEGEPLLWKVWSRQKKETQGGTRQTESDTLQAEIEEYYESLDDRVNTFVGPDRKEYVLVKKDFVTEMITRLFSEIKKGE